MYFIVYMHFVGVPNNVCDFGLVQRRNVLKSDRNFLHQILVEWM